MAIYTPYLKTKSFPILVNKFLSKFFFAGAIFLGAQYHDTLERLVDNVLYHNIPLEHNYFPDARGFKIDLELTQNGKRAYFLNYNETKIPITYNLVQKLGELSNEHIQTR
ncbi:hypothetical protein HYV79_05275 [Candidatus Woesearchaeota archaeon]|nr:hypothetical protein [Candidatus Woesearchaeota archaeon]